MNIHLQLNLRSRTGTTLLLLSLLAVTGASVAVAQTNTTAARATRTEASTSLSYDSFRLVNERNIFDGNRSGQRVRSSRSTSRQRSAQVESFNLVGTLVADGKSTAFFDGTDSSFRKALTAGSRISAFQVVDIQPAGVRLAEGTNTIDLKVGAGFAREDRGPWKTTGVGTKYVASTSGRNSNEALRNDSAADSNEDATDGGSTSDAEPSESASTGSGSMEANDVLKKLMEKRERE
jgi:hypothetical protein